MPDLGTYNELRATLDGFKEEFKQVIKSAEIRFDSRIGRDVVYMWSHTDAYTHFLLEAALEVDLRDGLLIPCLEALRKADNEFTGTIRPHQKGDGG